MVVQAFRLHVLGLFVLLLTTSGCAGLVPGLKNQPCALDAGAPFTTVTVHPDTATVRLFWRDEAGDRFGTLGAVEAWAQANGYRLVAATNGGIFEPGFVPTGLYVEDGEILQPLNTDPGEGNFFLLPNGVFYLTPEGAGVLPAEAYARQQPPSTYATQSGPLLLDDGQIHPAFTAGSANCRVRSGVGVRPDGAVVLAISNGAVNFYDFARLFRDDLGAPNALYLDGGISKLLAPPLGRDEDGAFASILAILVEE